MSTYQPLTEATAISYIKHCIPAQALLPADEPLRCQEVGDGNLNLIFRVQSEADSTRSLIVKQALPYLRLVGESWPLTTDRARIEADALAIYERLCPGLVPHTYLYDATMHLTVMEDLAPAIIMRKGLSAGTRYPRFATQIGEFLAQTLFATSDLALESGEKKRQVVSFTNPELCKLTEDVVFTEPYIAGHPNNRNTPQIDGDAAALRADEPLLAGVRATKWAFMTRAEALIHGDLHTGSIMITVEQTKVIDPEFAFYGPMGFDIGALLGNLLISYCAHEAHTPDPEARAAYQGWLLATVSDVWLEFASGFLALWHQRDPAVPEGWRQAFLLALLRDSAAFAGCKMIRRVLGVAHVEDLESIADTDARAAAERAVLRIARALVVERGSLQSIDDLVALARAAAEPTR